MSLVWQKKKRGSVTKMGAHKKNLSLNAVYRAPAHIPLAKASDIAKSDVKGVRNKFAT